MTDLTDEQAASAVRAAIRAIMEHLPAPKEAIAMEMLPIAVATLVNSIGAETTAKILEASAVSLRSPTGDLN
jgi:hypothetical protein